MRRRHLVSFVVLILGTRVAMAEPDRPGRAFFRASPSLTVASLHRVLTYSGFDGGPNDVVMEENAVDTTRVGGQLELAAGVQLGTRLQLGGVARYALVPNVEDARFGPSPENDRLDYLALGPQATVFATRHLYVRGEVALARISHALTDATGASAGVELGYGRIVDGRYVQLGVAASAARADYQEDGDHGTYDDRFRLVTVSAVLSMNLGGHP